MANKTLFQSLHGALLPAATAINPAGAAAYARDPKQALAQYAATGCLSNTFYAGAAEQLSTVLSLAKDLDAAFIAKTAIYARTKGSMKDVPALLLAILSTKDPVLLKVVFPRVVDNGRMVRNFVQILRSGVTGRKSPVDATREALFGWALDKTYAVEALPKALQ